MKPFILIPIHIREWMYFLQCNWYSVCIVTDYKALVPTHFGCGGGSAGKNVLKPGRVRIIVLSGGQDPSLGDYHPEKNNITSGHKQTRHHLLVKNRPSLASEWETLWGSLWYMTRIPKMKISWRRGEQYTSPVTYINWLNDALRGYHLLVACQQSDYAGVKTRQSILGLPLRKLAARHQGKGIVRFKQIGQLSTQQYTCTKRGKH